MNRTQGKRKTKKPIVSLWCLRLEFLNLNKVKFISFHLYKSVLFGSNLRNPSINTTFIMILSYNVLQKMDTFAFPI